MTQAVSDKRRNVSVSHKPTMSERYEVQMKDGAQHTEVQSWYLLETFTRRGQATAQRDRLRMTKPQWVVRIVRVVSISEIIPG